MTVAESVLVRPMLHTSEYYRLRMSGVNRIPQTLHPAWETICGLSAPSKMPGISYSLPGGYECPLGLKLGCASICYAGKGNYRLPHVKETLAHRRDAIIMDLPKWTNAMIEILDWYASVAAPEQRYHRWHDAGDLQSLSHLHMIIKIAKEVQGLQFWLPTRAYVWIDTLKNTPANLTPRLSSPKVDAKLLTGIPTSMIHTDKPPAGMFACPAPQNKNKCGDCRACWDRNVRVVSYHLH